MHLSELDENKTDQILSYKANLAKGSHKHNTGESGRHENENAYGDDVKIIHKLKRKQTYLSGQEVSEVIRLYMSDTPIQSIADKFGCHYGTIRNHLRRNGIV